MKIPSTTYQIPNKSQHAAQAPALRVTQIQKSKQRSRLPWHPTALAPAYRILRRGVLQFWPIFWSLDIEIWDLFIIWCLRFGILFHYKA